MLNKTPYKKYYVQGEKNCIIRDRGEERQTC